MVILLNGKKLKIGLIILEVAFLILAIICLYPIYQMIATSLKDTGEMVNNPIGFPKNIAFINYAKAWHDMKFPTAFASSTIITFGSLLGIIFFSSMAAYPLARINIKLNKYIYLIFVSGIMLPIHTALIPLVKYLRFLHLTNSYIGLILIYIATTSPFAIFVYTGFLKGVSREIEESAIIDGCNEYSVFWRIAMPLMGPATASIIIICSMWIWNDFLLPMVMIQDTWKKPLSPSVFTFFETFNTNWNYAFAGFVMIMIPIIIVFLSLQKQYIKGISAGAVKG